MYKAIIILKDSTGIKDEKLLKWQLFKMQMALLEQECATQMHAAV